MIFRSILCFALLCFCIKNCFSQTKVQGVIIDSANNNILRAVSVALFEDGKSTVEKVAITDKYGKFIIEAAPVDKPLILEFSFVGYGLTRKALKLKKDEFRDLGQINMPFLENKLEEVEIIAPVRMKGDTLEFNADAFKLDSNAVVQDLLRKLPGLVVWGDGAVTYNGKEIPQVLVNGKPFFGADMGIALQNISKNAIQKVQVYDSRTKEIKDQDPENHKYEMNLVLKDGQDHLYFGNLSIGSGTKSRYQGQLNLNKMTPKSQATIAFSSNNVNKDLQNIDQLLKNSTFKGVGINSDFNSDFLREGTLKQSVLGGRFQYDFAGKNNINLKNLIVSDVLAKNNITLIKNESNTTLLNSDNMDNSRMTNSENKNELKDYQANVSYNNMVGNLMKRPINLQTSLNLRKSKEDNEQNSLSKYNYSTNQLENNIKNHSLFDSDDLGISASMILLNKSNRNALGDLMKKEDFWDRIFYQLDFKGNVGENRLDARKENNHINHLDTAQNKIVDRTYTEKGKRKNAFIDLSAKENLIGVEFGVNLYVSDQNNRNTIYDQSKGTTVLNEDLSHLSDNKLIKLEPRIGFQKYLWNKRLYGRNSSSFLLKSKIGFRNYQEKNTSTLDYRNLTLKYSSFLPDLQLNYRYTKTSFYTKTLNFQYNYNEEYPLVNTLRPIYDNINPAYRYFGSERLLKKTGIHLFNINGTYEEQKQYGYNASFGITYRSYENAQIDSLVYTKDQLQAYIGQLNNRIGAISGDLNINKPFLINKNQTINIKLDGNLTWADRYQYTDQKLQYMKVNSQSVNLNLYYTANSVFQIGWTNGAYRYERVDKLNKNANNNYNSLTWRSTYSMAYILATRWAFNSSLTDLFNKSEDFTNNALIWNFDVSYRMLKGNNLEMKLSANDLLKQNEGIYFLNGMTEFTKGSRNILTSYYMLTLSYFPRKFGKKD